MISVHSVSMIYELRALRSRLTDMIEREAWLWEADDRIIRDLRWLLALVNLQILKTERTGEYIAKLENGAPPNEWPSSEAGVGTHG